MGKQGRAVVFLLPQEDTYIEYLKVKKVPITEVSWVELTGNVGSSIGLAKPGKSDKSLRDEDLFSQIQKMILQERELLDKSQLAFISYVRAYQEHQLTYIFRPGKLDLGRLACGFALLQLPRMPELKSAKTTASFSSPFPDLDLATAVKYKNKDKEKKRQEKIKLKQQQRQEEFEKRQHSETSNKKGGKLSALKQSWSHSQFNKKNRENQLPSVSDDEQEDADLEELMEDARMLKKRKRGKISEQQLDAALGFSSGEDDIDDDRHDANNNHNKIPDESSDIDNSEENPSTGAQKKRRKKNKK